MPSQNPSPTERKKPLAPRGHSAELRPSAAQLGLSLLLLILPLPAVAQLMPSAPADRVAQPVLAPHELLWVLPRAPLGAHCAGSVICTDLGTWGVHARLTGATLIREDSSLPGGLLTPAVSSTFGGWGEAGVHFPILLGPMDTPPLVIPPLLFAKGTFTPPWWIGMHGVLFATLTLPDGPFAAPDDNGQPMARRYEVGAAISGHLLWMLHYGFSLSGQLSPGGPPPRLLAGLHLEARLDGWNVFAEATHSAGFCWGGSSSPDCQSNIALLGGIRIPLVAGHSSAAAGLVRGAPGQGGTAAMATLGLGYDETTRAKYGNGIEKVEQLWVRLFTTVIDPYLDERCMLLDDDHTPMIELGTKSADGLQCERKGLRSPINTHFDRNKASTRVCYDPGLRNCILRRASDRDPWEVVPAEQQARRPYLKEDCHIYEAGVMLPLQQVGIRSNDGQACEWHGHRFPIGTEFWAIPGDDVMCQDATLKNCSIELPPKPMTTGQYVGSRAEQGLVRGVTNLVEKFERGPQTAADLAEGGLHVQTVAGEAHETLKDGLGHLTTEDAKKEAAAVVEAGRAWLDKPLHEQLGDVAEAMGELPARALENEVTGGLGNLAGGVGGAASVGGKVEKAAVKAEHAAGAAKTGRNAAHAATHQAERAAIHEVPAFVPKPGEAGSLPGRHGAFREAKRDAGISHGKHPDAVEHEFMTDQFGKKVKNNDGKLIETREYHYNRPGQQPIVIQEHSAGHYYNDGGQGDQGPHFNVRPTDDKRHGSVDGTKAHYPFRTKRK